LDRSNFKTKINLINPHSIETLTKLYDIMKNVYKLLILLKI